MRYHLIWTCYGQWLPGDERGYVDREHHRPGTPYPADDPQRLSAAANRMVEDPVWLDDPKRLVADEALRESCTFHGWECIELNVQPDHVHVAVRVGAAAGHEVRRKLKARAATVLNQRFGRRQHWWTDGGKVEIMSDEGQLSRVTQYIRDQRFPPPKAV